MAKTERHICCLILSALFVLVSSQIAMARDDTLIIDDRSSGNYVATSGNTWRLITDGVMGGVSDGRLSVEVVDNQGCLRLQGDVKLENNGGFIQVALDLPTNIIEDIQSYTGLVLAVHGNNEQYNIHLRTLDNWLPWQSYRASFTAAPAWTRLYIPFADFTPYRTRKALAVSRLQRIGIVAIGRAFIADLCIGQLGLYKQ